MEVSKIIDRLNNLVMNGMYDYDDIEHLADEVIDEINERLNTSFKVFSDMDEAFEDYNEFDDKYIRGVLIYGIAARLLEQEDEFEDQFNMYMTRYNTNLSKWLLRNSGDKPEEPGVFTMKSPYGLSVQHDGGALLGSAGMFKVNEDGTYTYTGFPDEEEV